MLESSASVAWVRESEYCSESDLCHSMGKRNPSLFINYCKEPGSSQTKYQGGAKSLYWLFYRILLIGNCKGWMRDKCSSYNRSYELYFLNNTTIIIKMVSWQFIDYACIVCSSWLVEVVPGSPPPRPGGVDSVAVPALKPGVLLVQLSTKCHVRFTISKECPTRTFFPCWKHLL